MSLINNKNNKIKKAFSLIELAVVVSIIAVLVVGITLAKSMISSSKLAAARSLTLLSPVPEIDGLQLWLESTMKDSFDADEAIEDANVETWYDLNPQSTTKFNVTSSSSNRPKYNINTINGLPTLSFDGTDDTLTSSDFQHDWNNINFTVFAVAQLSDTQINNPIGIVSNRIDNINEWWTIGYNSSSGGRATTEVDGSNIFVSYNVGDNNPYIYTFVKDGTTGTLTLSTGDSASSDLPTRDYGDITNGLHLGKWNGSPAVNTTYMAGFIAEIIIYDRKLSDNQIEDIKDYLSQKWNIELN